MWGDDGATAWIETNAVGQTGQRFYRVVRANPGSLNNGIPYSWAVDHGLDPLDPNLASEPSPNPWAHGLTNLQVYQNPSVLIADNYSTLGDGIADWWKVKYGFSLTDPNVAGADPDNDFWSNLAEYQTGTNPTDPNSYPWYITTLNCDVDVLTNTQLHIELPAGLVADSMLISEDITFGACVTNAFSSAFNYTLSNNVDGLHMLFLKLQKADGTTSQLFGRTVELDTVGPSISITSPTNGTVTANRRLNIEGFAADASTNASQLDATRPLQVTVNGEFVNDRDTNGVWFAGPEDLLPGTNMFVAVATDRAGWSTSNSVTIIYDPTLATNVPNFTVDVANTVIVGSNSVTIAVLGTIDDSNATVQIDVLDALDNTITNATISAAVHDTNWWAEVPVAGDSNIVVATAQNPGSPPATNSFMAIRDPNSFLEITSPTAGTDVNATNVTVAGLASSNFNGLITINGSPASTSIISNGIAFSGSVPINNLDVNVIEVHATGTDGSSATEREIVYGYEVQSYQDHWHQHVGFVGGNDWVPQHLPDTAWFVQNADDSDTWASPSATFLEVYHGDVYSLSGIEIDVDDDSDVYPWDPTSMPTGWYEFGWYRRIEMGDYKHAVLDWDTWYYYRFWNCSPGSDGCIDSVEETQNDTVCHHELTFIKHWPTDEEQTVVLHFDGFGYWDNWGAAEDASKVFFWGQPGFVYAPGSIGFIVKIQTNSAIHSATPTSRCRTTPIFGQLAVLAFRFPTRTVSTILMRPANAFGTTPLRTRS